VNFQNISNFWVTEAKKLGTAILWDASYGFAYKIDKKLVDVSKSKILAGIVLPVITDNSVIPLMQALDIARENDILVVYDKSNSNQALFGDIFAQACQNKKVAGIICFANIRDYDGIEELSFPVWAESFNPSAAIKPWKRSFDKKVMPTKEIYRGDYSSLKIGKTIISRGDGIIIDRDGIIGIPSNKIRFLIKSAQIKLKKEKIFKDRLRNGEDLCEMINLNNFLNNGEFLKIEF